MQITAQTVKAWEKAIWTVASTAKNISEDIRSTRTHIPLDCYLQQVGDGFVVFVQLVFQTQDSTPFYHTVLAKCFDWEGGEKKHCVTLHHGQLSI